MSPTESTQGTTLISTLRDALIDEIEAAVRALGFDDAEVLAAVRATARREHDERAGLSGRRGFAQADDLTASRISLVQEDELNFSLDLTNLTRALREHCGAELARLHIGYAALLDRTEISTDELPVGPATASAALRTLAEAAGLSSDQRTNLVEDAGRVLRERLRQFYATADLHLNEAGVKTERRFTPRSAGSAPGTTVAATQGTDPADAVTVLEHQLSNKRSMPLAATELDPSLVQGILGQIRAWLAEKQASQAIEVQLSGSGLTALLPATVATAIEAVERIFGVLASDGDLVAALRNMVARLQIPMLRLVLDHPESIAEREHPARQLINTLARLGVRLPNDAADSDALRTLAEMISELQHNPTPDHDAFAATLAGVETVVQSCNDGGQRATAPWIESAAKLDRREHALHTASSAIARITGTALVPAPVHDFLWTWWVQVLARTLYRLGDQHPRWREQVNAAHQLVLSARPIHAPQERARRLEMLPPLLRQLREGLAAVGTDEAACDRTLQPCMDVHAALLAGERVPDPAIRAPDPLPHFDRTPNKPPSLLGIGEVLREHGRGEAEPLTLAPGDVLEIDLSGEQAVRANVTWVAPLQRVALLLNQDGGEVIAAGLVALGRLSREHRLRRLGATDVFDQPASRVMETRTG